MAIASGRSPLPVPSFCCFCSVAKSRLTLPDPMDCSMPGSSVIHYLQEFSHSFWLGYRLEVPATPLFGSDYLLEQLTELGNALELNWNYLCLLTNSEKAMAPQSSTILAWKIPWMEEPGRLQSMGSLRVGHNWVTSLSLSTFMHWRRKWQPTPVFLPGESQGWGSL